MKTATGIVENSVRNIKNHPNFQSFQFNFLGLLSWENMGKIEDIDTKILKPILLKSDTGWQQNRHRKFVAARVK